MSDLGATSTADGQASEEDAEGVDSVGHAQGVARDEEDGLDSLDSHLYAFDEPYMQRSLLDEHNTAAVLPAHDGLGSFLERTNISQEHVLPLPQRPITRIQSALALGDDDEMEVGRAERIQAWRLEQSQILLERIEKEIGQIKTRKAAVDDRGKSSLDSTREIKDTLQSSDHDRNHALGVAMESNGMRASAENGSRHDGDGDDDDTTMPFWKRITRRVIRDIIGIDEPLLSIIMGETLPEVNDTSGPSAFLTGDPLDARQDDDVAEAQHGWEERLLERIALELGKVVHRISKHPGAFQTYLKTQEPPPYVGRTSSTSAAPKLPTPALSIDHRRSIDLTNGGSSQFFPSIPPLQASSPAATTAAAAGMARITPLPSMSSSAHLEAERLRLEREYWERELDISMVFSFFRSRFGRSPRPLGLFNRPSTVVPSNTVTSAAAAAAAVASTTHSSAAARAAAIRQHHPLVSQPASHHLSFFPPASSLKRSSCTSTSTTKSKKARGSERSATTTSTTSRNYYWDFGGAPGLSFLTATTTTAAAAAAGSTTDGSGGGWEVEGLV